MQPPAPALAAVWTSLGDGDAARASLGGENSGSVKGPWLFYGLFLTTCDGQLAPSRGWGWGVAQRIPGQFAGLPVSLPLRLSLWKGDIGRLGC